MIVVLIVSLALIVASLNLFFQKEIYVSNDSMDLYAKTFISAYNQYLSFFLNSTYHYFWFYSNNSYEVNVVISSSHGAAIWLEPSKVLTFTHTNTAERAEMALFKVSSHSAFVKAEGSALIFITDSMASNAALALVDDNATVIVEDCQVNSIEYHFAILKASNEISHWNTTTAYNDAKIVFDKDLYSALSNSEEVREHYAEPELNTLLVGVLTKWHNALNSNGSISYTMMQKEYDIKQIEELAKTKYGITDSDFINCTLTYLESVTLPTPTPNPTKTIFNRPVDDPNNWEYVGFLGGLPILDFAFFLLIGYYRKNRPSKLAKWLLLIPPFILGWILYDLLYYYPYDYQMVSAQTAVVIALWILGPITLFTGQKKLSRWLIVKKNKPQETNKRTKQKAKEHQS